MIGRTGAVPSAERKETIMNRRVVIGAALLAGAIAGPILAGFGAADLIYVPVASHSPGAVGSNWATDLYITNVDEANSDG